MSKALLAISWALILMGASKGHAFCQSQPPEIVELKVKSCTRADYTDRAGIKKDDSSSFSQYRGSVFEGEVLSKKELEGDADSLPVVKKFEGKYFLAGGSCKQGRTPKFVVLDPCCDGDPEFPCMINYKEKGPPPSEPEEEL